jgi:hypothetical protein
MNWVPDKGVLGSSLRYEGQADFLDADFADYAEKLTTNEHE